MRKVISELTLTTCVSESNKKFIVNAALAAIWAIEDLHEDCYHDIKVAFEEAVDNVIFHAYPNEKGDITVCISIYEDKSLEIKVTDFGCGIKDGTKRGIGFAMMQAFSKKLNVESTPGKGTVLTMTFEIM